MTRNIPLNQRELGVCLSVFEGQPLSAVSPDQLAERRALHSKFCMAYDGVLAVEEIIATLPQDFRNEVYDTYHGTIERSRYPGPDGSWTKPKGKIPAVKMVYDRLGKKSLIEAKQVAEAIGGEISS